MPRVLVTGMSGTGKSSALAELGRRGFAVVDTDEPGWKVWSSRTDDGEGEWVWDEDRMAGLLDRADADTLFVSGCVSNQGRFYDRFDAVVLLVASPDVILDRIAGRTTNDYGKSPAEREAILHDLESVEPRLRMSCTHEIDTSVPLGDVVDTLVRIARAARP